MRVVYVDDHTTAAGTWRSGFIGAEAIPICSPLNDLEELWSKYPIHLGPQPETFLILHGSNEGLEEPAGSDWFRAKDGDKKITYLVRRILEDGGRVLVFSEGNFRGSVCPFIEGLHESLPEEGWVDGHHFAVCTSLPIRAGLRWETLKKAAPEADCRVDEFIVPDYLAARRGQDTLSALAILCQGFLAVHAEQDKSGNWGPPGIAQALEAMRWPEFCASGGSELLPTDLSEKRPLVRSPDWWLGPFGRPGELVKLLEEEWGGSGAEAAPARKLVEELEAGRGLESDSVGSAFLALCAHLGID